MKNTVGFSCAIPLLLSCCLEAQTYANAPQTVAIEVVLKVVLYDDVKLPKKILAQSVDETTRILQKAGVTTTWITCKSSKWTILPSVTCEDPDGMRHLSLRIVPRAWRASDSIFGVAFLSENGSGVYGDVFYDSVEKLHRDWGASVPRVLGHVMAHELGHLLLGSNAHSRDGIMRPSWHADELQRASKGTLLFLPEQAQFIRQRLSRESPWSP